MRYLVEFTAFGRPAPQGSKQAFPIYSGKKGAKRFTGKVSQVEMSPHLKAWRADVAKSAMEVRPASPLDGYLAASVVFSIARPKKHYRTGRFAHVLREDAPLAPNKRPDLSKLLRSTEDALNGLVWVDDELVVRYDRLEKVYVGSADPDALDRPGVVVRVRQFVPAVAPVLPGMGSAAC